MKKQQRLNIDVPSDDYIYLKMLCAEKGVSIKDFLMPIILKAIDDEEDVRLAKKAKRRLKDLDLGETIPAKDAFKEAGWND